MKLKVLSWNIWLDGDLNGVVEFIKTADADIIGMQEVIPEREPNILESLSALGYQHAFSKVMELRRGGEKMGNAVFSRHKLLTSYTRVLSEEQRRVAEDIVLEIDGVQLRVFNTHLLHTHQKQSDIQDIQVETLLKFVPGGRAIVMGDFNATSDSGVLKKMTNVLNNTDPSNAPTWSMYPAGCHVCNPQAVDTRLDYIFASKDLRTSEPKVGHSKASDHLPISVTVEL